MSHIVTLVANPATHPLSDAIIARVRDAIQGGMPDILSAGEAVDIPCGVMPFPAQIAQALGDAPYDAITTKARGRRKGLLLADMDSTIVTTETLDEMAAHVGLKEKIAAITRASMNGEIDFTRALRSRVKLLKGLPLTALEATWARIEYSPGARELVATMRAHNAYTALVSGGFSFFTGRVAQALGFDTHRANVLGENGRVLSGKVREPILDADAKLTALKELAQHRKVRLTAAAAVGDGANDLAMLREAGLGVAYFAKPVVAAEARAQIRHTSLRALLFAQGYRLEQIVGG